MQRCPGRADADRGHAAMRTHELTSAGAQSGPSPRPSGLPTGVQASTAQQQNITDTMQVLDMVCHSTASTRGCDSSMPHEPTTKAMRTTSRCSE